MSLVSGTKNGGPPEETEPYVFSGCPPFPGPDLGFNFRTAQLHPSACGPVAVFVLVLALAFVPSVTSRGPRKCCPESGRNFSSAPKARWLLEKLLVCHLASRYARSKKRDARCEKQEKRYETNKTAKTSKTAKIIERHCTF